MRISDWSSDVCSSDLHLLVRGRSAVRLDVIGGTLLDGPASLRLDVSGIGHVDRATAALRDFLHLCRGGALPLKGTRLPPRAIDALRVHDALAKGASIRDIGVLLFGPAQIGRAHVCTTVTNAHIVCRLLLEKTKI